MIPGPWKSCLIDIDRATEFTGDDVDQYSELVDLGLICRYLLVLVPAITSATVTPYVQMDDKEASVPVAMVALDDDATGHFAHATTAGEGAIAVIFEIGAAQHIRLKTGANQAVDRTFYFIVFN